MQYVYYTAVISLECSIRLKPRYSEPMVAAIKPELTTTCWCPGAGSVCLPGPEPDAFAQPGHPSLSVGPIKISLNVCSFQGTEKEQERVMAINIPPRNRHMCLPFSLSSFLLSQCLRLFF